MSRGSVAVAELTEALGDLQDANTAVAEAAVAMNEGLGEEDAPTEYSADAEGVEEARADAQEAYDEVAEVRDNLLAETAATNTLDADAKAGVEKYLGDSLKLTEANLTTALEGVQAEIDADETLLRADGAAIGDDADTTLYAVTDLEGETAYVNADQTDIAQVATITLEGTPAADDTVTFNVNGTSVTATLTDSGNGVDGVTVTDLPSGFTPSWSDGIVINGPEGEAFTLTNVAVAADSGATDATADITTYYDAEDAEAAGYAEAEDIKEGVLAEDGELLSYTLADLQQEMLDAEQALADARDANSDADLLDAVRTEINDYLGAGGGDVDANGEPGNDLLELRTAISTELDKDTVDLVVVDVNSDALLSALAGGVELNAQDEAVSEGPGAPTSFAGQGEWIQGDVADEQAGTYEWTYQPTAAEQSLIDALADVEARNELIASETTTQDNFETAANADGAELGGQLLAIEGRLEALATAEQNVVDAQAELDEDNALIDGLESALSELDDAEAWFTDNDLALPVTVDGDEASTSEGDIFLFAEDQGEAFTISGFGAEGEDTLYFGGDYTVTELGADQAITDRVGSVDTLEIFWQQDGDDLQLYVEADAAAGFDRDGVATEQMTQITLEDFSAENITSFEGQSLIAGVAPATDDVIA